MTAFRPTDHTLIAVFGILTVVTTSRVHAVILLASALASDVLGTPGA